MNNVKEAVLLVFTKPKYILLAAIIAIMTFLLFLFLSNVPLFTQALIINPDLLFVLSVYRSVITTILIAPGALPIILMILVSIFTGIDLSMIIFKIKNTTVANPNEFSSIGASILAAFGAGCPACATSLLSLIGVAGGLSILPFGGMEVTSTSLVLLIASFYFISKDINRKTCKL